MQESPLQQIIVVIDDFAKGAVFIIFGSFLRRKRSKTKQTKG